MEKSWNHPFWENYQKDRITARLKIKHSDGKETWSTATISKYDAKGNPNPDFQACIDQNTIEEIDKNTAERQERHKRRREEGKKADKERQQALKLEDLFNAKLEIFEIDMIKNSKNRLLKSKIRKAKNRYEMIGFLSILMKEEYDAEAASKSQ